MNFAAWLLMLVAGGWVGFAYAGYPLLMLLISRVAPRPIAADDIYPPITLIIAVHNGEAAIGRRADSVFVERLWRNVKYEDKYLRAYETPTELRAGLTRYFAFYNTKRRHSALDRRTPDAVYYEQATLELAA